MNASETALLKDLLSRCALDDQRAFALLYQKVASKLNGVAYLILNNAESSNEVLQEAFIQIWKNASEYKADASEPLTWMTSIVRYRAYDRIKYEKRRIEGAAIKSMVGTVDEIESSGQSGIAMCEINQELNHCLSVLDTYQHESILLAYYFGFSRDELAEHFQRPINTVKSWLRRGAQRLRLCLGN